MNVTRYSVLLIAVACCSMMIQSMPRPMAVHDDRLQIHQIDQAFFRDLEQYRLTAAARRAHGPALPTATLSSMSAAADYGRS